jgi:hypothetical protein
MPRLASANTIINRAAVEIGLNATNDPVASQDESFVQLRNLLDSAGQELIELFPWQGLQKRFAFTTADTDSGSYALPDDYAYMIDQTGWDRSNRVAIGGPLSSQDWAYLEGRDLVSQSIYASFRLDNNKLDLYPQPPPNGLDISFEYMTRNWLASANNIDTRFDAVQTGSDLVLYEPILVIKFLKTKYLEAKGLDSSSARLEFETMLNARTGHDTGASILSASRNSRGFPYLHPYYSTSDTGYGIP